MNVIERQSIKQSLVNYFAILIAAYSVLFIYPYNKEIYGLARFVIDTSFMIVPFILMGINAVSIKFFDQFKNEKNGHNGFLFILILSLSAGILIFILLAFIFKNQIVDFYAQKSIDYVKVLPYILVTTILLSFIQLLVTYISNFKRIVVPAILQNLIKISLPILVLLYINSKINDDNFIWGIVLNFSIVLVGLLVYLKSLGQLKLYPSLRFLTKPRRKEMREFALYSLFASIGGVLATRIDSFMIGTLLDFKSLGAFGIVAFIANSISIPTNAIIQISGPIVRDYLKEGNDKEIQKLYANSSLNLLILGLLIFVCIILSFEELLTIMAKNEEFSGAYYIILFVGFAKIIDMGTSINNQIINYSKYYKFGFYAILFMAIINVFLNFIFIPQYHIVGAAFATFVSLTLYNIIKTLYIKHKFNIWPFTWNTIKILSIALFTSLIVNQMPFTFHPVINILLRSLIIIAIYTSLVAYFNLMPDVIKNRFRK